MIVGVLGLQGNYALHQGILKRLGIEARLVRYARELDDLAGLIIPGGESTTMTKLIQAENLRQPLLRFAKTQPVMGTCAGLIMQGENSDDPRVKPLGIIPLDTARNAFGRQVESFTDMIEPAPQIADNELTATFIRAPRITRISPEVEVLASYSGEPVAVRFDGHLGLSFHPELDDITLFHHLAFQDA